MASEWNEVPLSALAELSGGFAFKSGDYAPSGRFVLRTLNISNDGNINRDDAVYLPEDLCPQYSRFELKPADTLFVMVGATLGKIGFVREKDLPALLNQNMWLIRAKPEKVNPRFLHYAFRHWVKESLGWASGSARDFVRRDDYRNLKIPVPSLLEQKAIAHILGTLDDKIELNRRMNETLEAMARAFFKSWFVDFDPVRAKTENRDPGLPKEIADLFPAGFQDSVLGEIPKGWEVDSIYRIAYVVYGAPFASTQFNPDGNGKPLIRIRDLANESPRVWTAEAHPKGYMVHAGDIVVGMDGEFRAYIWGGTDAWLNQRLCVFVPRPGCSTVFVHNSIIEPLAHVEATEAATTVIHLGKSDIDRFSVLVPDARVLLAFNQHCQPWYDRIITARRESRTLASIRDALLPKLISGEVRVKDPDKFLKEVTDA